MRAVGLISARRPRNADSRLGECRGSDSQSKQHGQRGTQCRQVCPPERWFEDLDARSRRIILRDGHSLGAKRDGRINPHCATRRNDGSCNRGEHQQARGGGERQSRGRSSRTPVRPVDSSCSKRRFDTSASVRGLGCVRSRRQPHLCSTAGESLPIPRDRRRRTSRTRPAVSAWRVLHDRRRHRHGARRASFAPPS